VSARLDRPGDESASRLVDPIRVLGAALVIAGALVLAKNVGAPDESRVFGVAFVVIGLAAALRPGPRSRAALEIGWVVALILAGGEVTTRHENEIAAARYADQLMHFVDDPLLRYEFKPRTRCDQTTTNELGMMDVPRAREKLAGTLRVACLGDSVGGDCSLPNDNACAALERELTRARGGRPVEVLNFSTPGYNTMQEARTLEQKALAMSPDAVVVLYVINDPYPDLAISHFLPGNLKFEHFLYVALKLGTSRVLFPKDDPFGGWLKDLHDQPRSWDGVVVAGFDRIEAAVKPRGLPVAVAVFPLFVEHQGEDERYVYRKVVGEAERHGFVGVDLSTAAYANEPLTALLKPSRDMIHPNAHAHELAAKAIAAALVAKSPGLLR
jgi:lysophospholipase L1-like esterase